VASLPTVHIDLLPLTYEGLPEPERFVGYCRRVAEVAEGHPLFKHYPVKFTSREDLSIYWPALLRGVVPPRNTRYNAMDGWLTVKDRIRARAELLFTVNPVDPGGSLHFPGLEERYRVLVAIVPCSIRTTPQIWAEEKHFSSGADMFASPHSKAFGLVYHHTLVREDGTEVESGFRELDPEFFGHELAEVIAERSLGIEDVLAEVVRIEFGYETRAHPQKPEVLDRMRVLYLGGAECSDLALKRSLLLFDDLHFHDRPAVNLRNWGTIGGDSSLRQLSYGVSREGVPLLVHRADQRQFKELAVDTASADLEDPEFSKVFADAFLGDASFRRLFLQHEAQYPGVGGVHRGSEVAAAFAKLGAGLGGRSYDFVDLENWGAKTDPSDETSLRRTFGTFLVGASLEVSLCCYLAQECDLVLLAEHPAYQKLLQVRYNRERQESKKRPLMPSLPVLAVRTLDTVIPPPLLEKASLLDVITFRKEMRPAYERFRRHLVRLTDQLEHGAWTPEFEAAIERMMRSEVRPAVESFEDECKGIVEKLHNELYKDAMVGVAAAAGATAALVRGDGVLVTLLSQVSFAELLLTGCGILAARVLPKIRDFHQEQRQVRRANALSYLLDFRQRLTD